MCVFAGRCRRAGTEGGGAAAPCPPHGGRSSGKGQEMSFNQQEIIMLFAQYKLAYITVTAFETVLLASSSLVNCIFVVSQEF